jgi:hypothetical protein
MKEWKGGAYRLSYLKISAKRQKIRHKIHHRSVT